MTAEAWDWSDIDNPVSSLGFPPSIHDLKAARAKLQLAGCWVIMLRESDGEWSLWSVIAFERDQAVALARRDWCDWCGREGEPDEPEVVKVYRNSWIGEIA